MPTGDAEVAVTLEVINAELQGRLERLSAISSGVDTKAAVLLGLAAAGIQVLVATKDHSGYWTAAAYALYALSVFGAVFALRLRGYAETPNASFLVEHFSYRAKIEVIGALIGTRLHTVEVNERIHQRKATWWWAALLGLSLAVTTSTVAFAVGGPHDGGNRVHPSSPASSSRDCAGQRTT